MSETSKDDDKDDGDEVMRHLLKTPPDPARKARTSAPGHKLKPGGNPAKNDRPAKVHKG